MLERRQDCVLQQLRSYECWFPLHRLQHHDKPACTSALGDGGRAGRRVLQENGLLSEADQSRECPSCRVHLKPEHEVTASLSSSLKTVSTTRSRKYNSHKRHCRHAKRCSSPQGPYLVRARVDSSPVPQAHLRAHGHKQYDQHHLIVHDLVALVLRQHGLELLPADVMRTDIGR